MFGCYILHLFQACKAALPNWLAFSNCLFWHVCRLQTPMKMVKVYQSVYIFVNVLILKTHCFLSEISWAIHKLKLLCMLIN